MAVLLTGTEDVYCTQCAQKGGGTERKVKARLRFGSVRSIAWPEEGRVCGCEGESMEGSTHS